MPQRRDHLPQQFDPVTSRTIELTDVLWLDGDAIVAAFGIESTTSIYSGMLRMSDVGNLCCRVRGASPRPRRTALLQRSAGPGHP